MRWRFELHGQLLFTARRDRGDGTEWREAQIEPLGPQGPRRQWLDVPTPVTSTPQETGLVRPPRLQQHLAMYDILEGTRVVELAMFAFGPSACAVLGDWGADVVKVGHPAFQDPLRGIPVQGLSARDDDLSFTWEMLNRNKRSIAIDVALPQGREVLDDLVARTPTCSSRTCCPTVEHG